MSQPSAMRVIIDDPLQWRDVAAVAAGAELALSEAAWSRVDAASHIVAAIVNSGIRAYGVNTGVGALADMVVASPLHRQLSRNLLMSHACGVGVPLEALAVRAIIAAQLNNYAHGLSGIRPVVVRALLGLLAANCIPEVPSRGSVGYLTDMAHIGLVLIGEGRARIGQRIVSGGDALRAIGQEPMLLEAKEGLSLINGSQGATGLACLALARTERLLLAADAVAAMTLEVLGVQTGPFDEAVLAVRKSAGLQESGRLLRAYLAGSKTLAQAAGRRTQDALSLRAVPHVHGAARDGFAVAVTVVDRELASVTDNPIVSGTPETPHVASEAHAVAPALALAMDGLAIAIAQLAGMSERRIDRLVNPLVSGLPPFLAADPGVGSGYMIAQYTAAALAAENRRLAAPASLDGGVTSGLQEDFLAHPTAAAIKLLAILDNAEQILGIELLAAADAHDLQPDAQPRAPATAALQTAIRAAVPVYRDDRPLADHLLRGRDLVAAGLSPMTSAVTDHHR